MSNTLLANLERFVSYLIAPTNYYAVYTASITSINNDATLDISPDNPVFAGMTNVPVYPGVAGCVASLQAGQMVLFSFANGNPGAPYVLGVLGAPTQVAITAPNVYLNPADPVNATPQAARFGDSVSVTTTTNVTQTQAQAIIALAAAPPPGTPVPLTGTGDGTITSGSSSVGIGPAI